MKSFLAAGIFFFAGMLSAQNISISSVVAVGLGDQSFSPGSEVYIYGSFPQNAALRDFSITAGGATGPIAALNTNGYIVAVIPFEAVVGPTSLYLTYKEVNSNSPFVTLKTYSPEFVSGQPAPFTSKGPVFPISNYYPLSHADAARSPVTLTSPALPGELLVANMTGLGQTNPPLNSYAISPAFSPLAAVPTMTLGGKNVSISRAGNQGGANEVDFVVPSDAPLNLDALVLSIGGISSNTILVPVGPQPDVTSVLNGASFRSSGTVAAGSIVSIFGLGFGNKDAAVTFPATAINGISAIFGGIQAPIFGLAGSAGQINVLVPNELPPTGSTTLTLQGAGGTSVPFALTLAPAVPGIFFYLDPTLNSRRNAVAVVANTAWIAMPTSMAAAMGLPQNCNALGAGTLCGQPAHAGDYLQIYVTGLGRATVNGDPAALSILTGNVAPVSGSTLFKTVSTPTVTIGGLSAPVLFSGVAPGYAGLYQVDVQIPAGVAPGSDVPLLISMPGSTVDSATIAVQ